MPKSFSFLMVVFIALAAYLVGTKFPAPGTAVLSKVGLAA